MALRAVPKPKPPNGRTKPMNEENKRPLLPEQYLWNVDRKDGKWKMIVGPDGLETTADDLWYVADESGDLVPVDSSNEAIQGFVVVEPGAYVVLHNHAESFDEEYPNGRYSDGRNEMKALRYGKKRVITSGHFPLWPGQRVDRRQVHHLSASQFLTVVVEDQVDPDAPYYEITLQCAKITTAVVDETVAGDEGESLTTGDLAAPDTDDATAEEPAAEGIPEGASPEVEAGNGTSEKKSPLRIGQRINILGSLTPDYIPPSGIEVVPEEAGEVEPEPEEVEDQEPDPGDVIRRKIAHGDLDSENVGQQLSLARLSASFESVEDDLEIYRERGAKSEDDSLWTAISRNLDASEMRRLAKTFTQSKPPIPTRDPGRVVREAVVLGPTQHAVLIDEEGKPQTKKGPGRVFPGPNDRFRLEGSDNGVYDDYHIRGDRGILIRVVTDSIAKRELAIQLPPGTPDDQLEKDKYGKGDEIFLGGFDAYLVPSSSIEVINPKTRRPHIGNDHTGIYIEAIGVDQKSGIYVRDVETGNVELTPGEQKVMLDPRMSEHAKRRVPGRMWNLMIGEGEPHKRVLREDDMVETPWALSTTVDNNKAALVVSKDGRRPIMGPGMELLKFEENLEVLTLSRGRGKPKSDEDQLETCYLRVTGNRISDQVDLMTKDSVVMRVDLIFGVQFIGDTKEERIKWFNHKDYVMLLCAHLRSILVAAARQHTHDELYPDGLADFVRDTILGSKPEDGGPRPGKLFEENNMLVNEVEVSPPQILDSEVAEKLAEINRRLVTRRVEDTAQETELVSDRRRDEMAVEKAKITDAKRGREQEVALVKIRDEHEASSKEEELAAALETAKQAAADTLARAKEEATSARTEIARARIEEDTRSKSELRNEDRAKVVVFRQELAAIQKELVAATAEADVSRLNAVQAGLIEAIEGLGDKQVLTAMAEHLPEATGELGFLLGHGGIAGLMRLVKDSPLGDTLEALTVSCRGLEAGGETTLDEDTADSEVDGASRDDLGK